MISRRYDLNKQNYASLYEDGKSLYTVSTTKFKIIYDNSPAMMRIDFVVVLRRLIILYIGHLLFSILPLAFLTEIKRNY